MILWTITIILVVGLMGFEITVASRHVAGLNGPWKKIDAYVYYDFNCANLNFVASK